MVSATSNKRRFLFGLTIYCANDVRLESPVRELVNRSFHFVLSCGNTEYPHEHGKRVDNRCTGY